jgi:hypothetical protein
MLLILIAGVKDRVEAAIIGQGNGFERQEIDIAVVFALF